MIRDDDIVSDNLRAIGALYFAWQLEQAGESDVVDRIVERWRQGLLPLGRAARANLYARVFGAPGGTPDVAPNRDFEALLLRFVASVALFARQAAVDDVLAAPRVRAAHRALAALASARGTVLAAEDPPTAASGARDVWQVIDQVSTLELGGANDAERHRALARSGGEILRWLGEHASADAQPPAADANLLRAVDTWIVASGFQPSPPTDFPAIVDAALAKLGLPPGARPRPTVALLEAPAPAAKTLAASALAERLGLDLLRIDLGRVVSRYVEETEKHLDAIFARADASDGILFFDEADALFGKRPDVADAHDRYANLASVSRRLDTHQGVVMLATRRPPARDGAFARARWRKRLRILRFPLPR